MDAVALTRDLIAYDTRNPPGDESACAGYLGEILADHGFAVRFYEFGARRASLVARRGGEAGKPLCFTGHIDVVPLGTAEWSVDPFGGEILGGKLYGRGASDMKGGVAAFVTAACELADELDRGPGVELVITGGEETGCEGAFDLARRDGALGEAGAVIVAEPTYNRPYVGQKGVLWLKGWSHGKTAHGSMPDKGVNALYKAARAVGKLEDFDFNVAPHPLFGRPTLSVDMLQAGQNVNSVPDRAEMAIDIRTLPGMDHAQLRAGLGGYLAPDVDTLEALVDLEGIFTAPEDAWVASVFRLVGRHLDGVPEPATLPGFTDAAALTPAYGGAPTLILGPGETAMAHQTDEYCPVAHITRAVAIFKDIARAWNAPG